jgi:hypothetical protein
MQFNSNIFSVYTENEENLKKMRFILVAHSPDRQLLIVTSKLLLIYAFI